MNTAQLRQDLKAVYQCFPLSALLQLRENRHRLIRNHYFDENGNGCLMYLLSETMPESQRIHSKESLIQYFSDGDPDAESYQPAKWIVRLWDERVCSTVTSRYGNAPRLNSNDIFAVLEDEIDARQQVQRSHEEPSSATEAELVTVCGDDRFQSEFEFCSFSSRICANARPI